MLVRDEFMGIFILVRFKHPKNAEGPMIVRDEFVGIVMLVRLKHSENAKSLTIVTDESIVTAPLQFVNALQSNVPP
jgi:hypothetical protein